jgi:hypothetical protein
MTVMKRKSQDNYEQYQEMHQVDVEEIMWKRLCGREEMFNISLVSIKMVDNRVVRVASTTRTRKHRSSSA